MFVKSLISVARRFARRLKNNCIPIMSSELRFSLDVFLGTRSKISCSKTLEGFAVKIF